MTAPAPAARPFGDRSVLVVLNAGIGNRVIAAPFVEWLRATYPATRLRTFGTPIPPGLLADRLRGQAESSVTLPSLWRRFRDADHDAILGYLTGEGIDLLVNLRKEVARLDEPYLRFRALAESNGVECWDLHELGDDQPFPIQRQCVTLLRRHGLPVPALPSRWLGALRDPAPDEVLGLFVGASKGVKRWPARRWSAVVDRLLADRPGTRIEVAAGTSPAEAAVAAAVVAAAGDARATHRRLGSFDDVVRWVARLTALATCDTGAAHVAGAVGTPALGVYFSTLGSVWAPDAPGFVVLQSGIGAGCRAMKEDGTCARLSLGCPAPCRAGVDPAEVAGTLAGLAAGGAA